MNKKDKYIVAFCGLPSSGKSTLINSLIGERILQSGVCRTTTGMNELTEEIITDDNGNKFIAIDLPGICDSEEKDTKFNEITNKHITRANLIFFVSDVNKAFITTHEVNEYNKIKKIVKDLEKDTGTIYDVAIILSKCDFNVENKQNKIKVPQKNTREICDSDEDTDLSDLVKKVKEKLPNEDIILFNAFGRIKHSNKISKNLKKLVEKSGSNPTSNNIHFSIKKYCYEINRKQELSYVEKFNKKMELYLKNEIQLFSLMNAFSNMNEENQYYTIDNYSESKIINYKIFDFMCTCISRNNIYDRNKNKFSSFYINYYIDMLNNNMLEKSKNFVADYNDKIWNYIQNKFNDLSFDNKNNIFDGIIFKNKVFTNMDNSVTFLNNCYIQNGGFIKFDFYNKFNKFIKSYNKQEFDMFYNLMISFCTPKNVQLQQIPIDTKTENKNMYRCIHCSSVRGHEKEANGQTYWFSDKNQQEQCKMCNNWITISNQSVTTTYMTRDNDKIISCIDNYLKDLKEQINDPKYILYNKLQILKYLFDTPNPNMKQSYHFKENKLKGSNWTEQKILNHPEYKKIEKEFYNKFLGNIIIPYVKEEDIVFVSLDEILYTSNEYTII
jgi:GTPase Era involved in 16S rRNA processing